MVRFLLSLLIENLIIRKYIECLVTHFFASRSVFE